ncbi:MAG: T9SS type A sorting domain-containing protein [Bacteroidia bacterium]
MKKIYSVLLLSVFVLLGSEVNATTWSISTPGTFFSPSLVTITLGDTVIFSINSNHNATEVSQATWNANGSTPNGGFQFFSPTGGTFIPTLVQTYYYVCQPHVGSGMKGRIVVNTNTGINNVSGVAQYIQFYPNPATSVVQINSTIKASDKFQMNVYNVAGKKVFSKENISNTEWLNVSLWARGIYFVEIRNSQKVYARKLEVAR